MFLIKNYLVTRLILAKLIGFFLSFCESHGLILLNEVLEKSVLESLFEGELEVKDNNVRCTFTERHCIKMAIYFGFSILSGKVMKESRASCYPMK